MDRVVVYQKMRELEVKIHYHFNDIAWLSKAMRSEKIEVSGEGKNHSEYTNDGLATIGDTVLKSVIADYLYRKGITTKGEITQIKSKISTLRQNITFRQDGRGIICFCSLTANS